MMVGSVFTNSPASWISSRVNQKLWLLLKHPLASSWNASPRRECMSDCNNCKNVLACERLGQVMSSANPLDYEDFTSSSHDCCDPWGKQLTYEHSPFYQAQETDQINPDYIRNYSDMDWNEIEDTCNEEVEDQAS
jgi:hypothetical protein